MRHEMREMEGSFWRDSEAKLGVDKAGRVRVWKKEKGVCVWLLFLASRREWEGGREGM